MKKVAIIVFPGSNCDHDAFYVFDSLENVKVDFIWHKDGDLSLYDIIVIPGGFSYGDYLRAGAIARFSPIMKSIIAESKKGKKIIGICNGFQILIECGLLPGALIINKNIKFLSKMVCLDVINDESAFTHLFKKGDLISMPIAHRQGNYLADSDLIHKLEDNNQIAFKYHSQNLNGSVSDIAGIFNNEKNVLGMMPHPERASDLVLGSDDGLNIFKSILEF
ncbi:MAG: phosphoribosylformylglycinamidine synthase I [Candidatus Marinimicrobia bacterium]|nr:phosphoribosylformylglycinamidine synthase I [Candidatus Neomarinimicrobiota bacterium]